MTLFKYFSIFSYSLLSAFGVGVSGTDTHTEKETKEWRLQYEESLKKNWLVVVGLEWVDSSQEQSVGSDADRRKDRFR